MTYKPIPAMSDSDVARFLSRVIKTDSCWLWTGQRQGGYGVISLSGVNYKAHRVSIVVHGGGLDPTLTIDHLCRTPACVNPTHLQQIPMAQNASRMWITRQRVGNRETCSRGHKLTPENTHRAPRAGGYTRVSCRRCHAEETAAARRRARPVT